MSNLNKAIQDLEEQKKRIDNALRILRELNSGRAVSAPGIGRNISPEGRRRIAEAQKRRWAKVRAAKKA
ncbi:MAG TPA: hypothetical protein VN515_06670 [Terriglobales bacterium]|nr:hypothetical protein [Terriglobales bacterium]